MHSEVTAVRAELRQISQRLDMSGQTTFYATPSQAVKAVVRAMQEALAREQEAPQILRIARLARTPYVVSDPELGAEFREMANATLAFGLVPGSPSDSKVRSWSMRVIITITSLENFDVWRSDVLPVYWEQKPLNAELKLRIRIRARAEAALTPHLVTDRDVVIVLDDDNAAYRWGFVFQGHQYVAIFARWFDELWAGIPDGYLIGTRGGLNQQALDRIRKELEAVEAASDRRSA
jgi:hypothetical protein